MTAESILGKIQHLLNKTVERGCTEEEAQSAAEMAQRLLTKHNLTMVDLEKRGHQKKPGVHKAEHDLGKAAFRWKLLLADIMASHYFCHSLTDHVSKRVFFVGRPDNTKALTMLYVWVIDQIKSLSTEEWKAHQRVEGNPHIDPLRWQVNFGEGAAYRLGERLRKMKEQQGQETTALVLHHLSEISDWLEDQGYWRRPDGQETKADRKRREEHERRVQIHEHKMETDPEYRKHYEELIEEARVRQAEEDKKEAKRRRRRTGGGYRYREETDNQRERRQQQNIAHEAGSRAADRVNLEPFIEGTKPASRAVPRNT